MKEKIIYQEKYKNPGVKMFDHALPTLNHTTDGFEVSEASILEMGVVEKDGERQEYNIIKVYLKEKYGLIFIT